jgi:hypothetical protein
MESTIEEDVILDDGYTQSELEEDIRNEKAWETVAEEAQEHFESLVAEAIAFANKYIKPCVDADKTFSAKFAAQADLFIELKAEFQTIPGSHKQTMRSVDGIKYTWTTFCPAHLGVSAKWVNAQIQKYRAPQDGSGKLEKLDEQKSLYKKGFAAGIKKAKDDAQLATVPSPQPSVLVTDEDDDAESLPADPELCVGFTDATAYFAPYKKDTEPCCGASCHATCPDEHDPVLQPQPEETETGCA